MGELMQFGGGVLIVVMLAGAFVLAVYCMVTGARRSSEGVK